jgi:hypothetical protein
MEGWAVVGGGPHPITSVMLGELGIKGRSKVDGCGAVCLIGAGFESGCRMTSGLAMCPSSNSD